MVITTEIITDTTTAGTMEATLGGDIIIIGTLFIHLFTGIKVFTAPFTETMAFIIITIDMDMDIGMDIGIIG